VSASRVVLVDQSGDLAAVAEPLAELDGVECELRRDLPQEQGVVAVLVPPEVRVGAGQLRALPDVRVVVATSTGYDHLDLSAIADAGAWATHCAGYCDDEVADHTIAFALDLLRGVTLLDRSVRSGGWDVMEVPPRRIAGSVLGIVGLGRIGREVAARAVALGMRVLGADPVVGAGEVPGVELTTLDALLGAVDVLTVHAPLTPETRGLIGAAQLAAMRPDAYLINCARAALIDRDALGAALRDQRLAGCALDVLEHEPPAGDEPELTWPRTLINPHAAWYSPRSAREPYRRAGEAVRAVLSGEEPRDVLARPA
jgi:D-3-phosphoglycerate dehydrogenase / 2-oxoglutarate reductase